MKHANGATAPERARITLSGFYFWAVDKGHVEDNLAWRKSRPRKSNQKKTGNGRNRTPITPELAEIWNACEDDEYGKIDRLPILTLQRREEIAGLRRSEFDLVRNNMIALPGFRTKTITITWCRSQRRRLTL
jgi:integrase